MAKPYDSLAQVLKEALLQAAEGKGKERHAVGDTPFEQQPICQIARNVGLGFPLGQAIKKIIESQRLEDDAGVMEIFGAINYLAAAVIVRREDIKPYLKIVK